MAAPAATAFELAALPLRLRQPRSATTSRLHGSGTSEFPIPRSKYFRDMTLARNILIGSLRDPIV